MNKQIYLGTIILLVSIVIPLHKIEKLGKSAITEYAQLKVLISEQQVKQSSIIIINAEIEDIRNNVTKSRLLINELIQQSYELNEEINKVFNNPGFTNQRADSVYDYYSTLLLKNENNLDSVNLYFGKQSDLLISKLNMLSQSMLIVNTNESEYNKNKFFLIIDILYIFIYLFLFGFGLTKSITLLRQ